MSSPSLVRAQNHGRGVSSSGTSNFNPSSAGSMASPPSPPSPPSSPKQKGETGHVSVQAMLRAALIISENREAIEEMYSSYRDCDELKKENAALSRTIGRVQVENDELRKNADNLLDAEKSLKSLKSELAHERRLVNERDKQLKKSSSDITEVQKALKQANSQVDALKEKLKTAKAAADERHCDLEKELKARRQDADRLKVLDGYLLSPKETKIGDVTRLLDGMFNSVYTIAENFFAHDLDDAVFAGDAWTAFKKEFSEFLPLPASNSVDAKAMRSAAVVRFIAEAATEELFQPAYLCREGDHISIILNRIGNVQQADWLRRGLLQALKQAGATQAVDDGSGDDDNEELQVENAKERAETVSEQATDLVKGLVPQDRLQHFTRELEKWCYTTATMWWTELQPLEQRIVALDDLDTHGTAASDWAPLNASYQPSLPPIASLDDVAVPIWPVFRFSDNTIVKHGVAITKAQVAKAREEDLPTGLRRSRRKHTRTMSLSLGISGSATATSPRISIPDSTNNASAAQSPFLGQGSPGFAGGVLRRLR